MQIKERKIPGVFEITLEPHRDNRGLFVRTYDEQIFHERGLNVKWVQENQSFSRKKSTLRGLHFQFPPYGEIKLVRAVHGEMFMAYVDIRKSSATLGQWESIVLSESNVKALYIPAGIALGMCTLTNNCTLVYKMSENYTPESQGTIRWNDPDIGIKWPIKSPIISDKDSAAMSFKDFMAKYGGLEI